MNKAMKIILILSFILPVLTIVLAQLGLFSGRKPTDLGVADNRLKAPSKNENSVSSQSYLYTQNDGNIEYAKIEPIVITGESKAEFTKLKEVIKNFFPEAQMIEEKENYLRYEFKTKIMKYVDDVEFLLSAEENKIHFRSASRLGRKDFGKNRDRMNQIKSHF